MGLKQNSFSRKDLALAISFESSLIKLYLRTNFAKWIVIGVASHGNSKSPISKTEKEIFSIKNPSDPNIYDNKEEFGSLEDLSRQIKALSPEKPVVDIWLPDELILCQTLLHKQRLTQSEATEIVAKSCKMRTEELCLVLSPEYRERSQKISAVTFEAIDNIKSFLNTYGILTKRFKAKDPQPGFEMSPTFYKDDSINFQPSLFKKLTNKAPHLVAIVLASFTFASVISEKTLQTQTSIKTITNLIEEENFSFRSPLSFEILSETTFPYFAPQLHNTMERKVFRLTSFDVGSKLVAPQLRNNSENEKPLNIEFGPGKTIDDFKVLDLATNNLDPSQSFDDQLGSTKLEADNEIQPVKIEITFLTPPKEQQKPKYLYEDKELGLGLRSKYPSLKTIQGQTDTFGAVLPVVTYPTVIPPALLSLKTSTDKSLKNYQKILDNEEYFLVSFKKLSIGELQIQNQLRIRTPNISDFKVAKLNINPTRLDQPNLFIDKLTSSGKVSVEIPTANSEIEFIILTNTSGYLPKRPKIQNRLTLNEPTMSSGALAFINYPFERPKNIKDIAKVLRSKKRINAKASVGPRIPNRSFAPTMATLSNRIELDRTNLLGVFGSKSNPYALIMLPTGEMIKISVGDQFLGWRVYGIDEDTVHVQNGLKQEVLRIPG